MGDILCTEPAMILGPIIIWNTNDNNGSQSLFKVCDFSDYRLNHLEMHCIFLLSQTNSADPDQTAPVGAV